MTTDPISEIVGLVEAKSIFTGTVAASGDWAIRFPRPTRVKLFAILRGSCFIDHGKAKRIVLREGDTILLSAPHEYVMGHGKPKRVLESRPLFASTGSARIGDGREFLLLGGHVSLDEGRAALLVDALPQTIFIRAGSDEAAPLSWILKELQREHASERPGTALVRSQLAQMMFVQMLRAYLATDERPTKSWMGALRDKKVEPALRLMHAEPGRAWTLPELARATGMSRSAFAERWKERVGQAPLAYLTEWRMRLAERELKVGEPSVAELASRYGYGSESAFSTAFKRVTGQSPMRYRSTLAPPLAEPAEIP